MSTLLLHVGEDACEHVVIRGLRARNLDVLTTVEANRLGSDDAGQLAFAMSIRRAIYTFNVGDFTKLHNEYLRKNKTHASIVVIPDRDIRLAKNCVAWPALLVVSLQRK